MTAAEAPVVLVVGDFLVDRAWVVEAVPSSERLGHGDVTGYRRRHPGRRDARPGGAGLTCLALRALLPAGSPWRIHGLGLWRPDADPLWRGMGVRLGGEERSGAGGDATAAGGESTGSGGEAPFTLHRLRSDPGYRPVTVLKHRYYLRPDAGPPRLGGRFDQEPAAAARYATDPLPSDLPASRVGAVVLVDLEKHTVTPGLLAALERRFPPAPGLPWFVDSRSPSTLAALAGVPLRLLSVNRAEAARAASEFSSGGGAAADFRIPSPATATPAAVPRVLRALRARVDAARWLALKLDRDGAVLEGPAGDGDAWVLTARREAPLSATGIGAGDFFLAGLAAELLGGGGVGSRAGPGPEACLAAGCAAAGGWLRFSEVGYWRGASGADGGESLADRAASDIPWPWDPAGLERNAFLERVREELGAWRVDAADASAASGTADGAGSAAYGE